MLWIALIRRDKHISELNLQLKLNILYYIILPYIPHFSLVIPEFSHIEYQKHF